jgi:hypothetical protein
MAKHDTNKKNQECTEVFELVGQDIQDLALVLRLTAQSLDEGLLNCDDLLQAFSFAQSDGDNVIIH